MTHSPAGGSEATEFFLFVAAYAFALFLFIKLDNHLRSRK